MRLTFQLITRLMCVGLALLLMTVMLFVVFRGKAYAVAELSNRNINMSSSAPGSVTLGTGVTYKISFTTTTSSIIEGVVVNFCDNDPIIGDTCTYTSSGNQSINLTSASLSAVSGTQDNTASHWTMTESDGTASDGGMLSFTDTTGAESTTPVSSGSNVSFTVTGITNPQYATCSNPAGSPYPTPNCAFYARMLTYSAVVSGNGHLTASGGYSVSTSSNYGTDLVDDGGAALSTAAVISVTSKVQEELGFCVYTNPAGSSDTCTTGSAPAVALGNVDDVLSTQTPFIDETTQFDIQTNASVGAQVMMQGNTLQSTGGATITAMSTVPNPSTANDLPVINTSQFGLCDYGLSGFSGNLTWPTSGFGSDAGYYSGSDTDGSADGGSAKDCSNVTQNSGTNSNATTASMEVDYYFGTAIGSTFGDTIAVDSAGPTNTGIVAFMADIPITQQAGIYTTSLVLIADGTY